MRIHSLKHPLMFAMFCFVNSGGSGLAQTSADAALQPQLLSIEDVLQEHSAEPESLYKFVAESVAFHAYPGVLRGANGALLSSAGNSYDQSLLLSNLLRDAGFETRLAQCRLGADKSEALIASIANPTVSLEESPNLEIFVEEGETAVIDQFADRVSATYIFVEEHLTGANVIFDQDSPSVQDELRETVSDHIWVQMRDAEGWTDFDPAFAGPIGETHCEQSGSVEKLPETAFHRVEISLDTETVKDGVPTTHTNFSFSALTADISGTAFLLIHEQPGQSGVTTFAQGVNDSFTPVLIAGDQRIEGEPVELVVEVEADSGSSGGGGLFGGLNSLSTALSNEQPTELVAEWLSLTFVDPTGAMQSVRHEVYDRVGHAARIAGNPNYAELPAVEADWADTLRAFTVTTGFSPASQQHKRMEALTSDDPNRASAAAGALILDFYGYLRETVPSMSFDMTDVTSYPSGPNLMFLTYIGSDPEDADGPPSAFAIDHALKSRRVIAKNADAIGPYERVFDGILDHEVERLTVALTAWAIADGPMTSISVGDVFNVAASDQIEVNTLAPADVAMQNGLSLSDEALTRLNTDMVANMAVIVPIRPVTLGNTPTVGWWGIDVVTGRTQDQMEDGSHQGGAETTDLNAQQSSLSLRARQLLCGLGSLAISIGSGMGPLAHMPPGLMQGAQQLLDSCARRGGGARGRPPTGGSPPGGGAGPGMGPYKFGPPPNSGLRPFPPPRTQIPPRPRSPLPPRGRPVPKKPFDPFNPTRPAPLRRP